MSDKDTTDFGYRTVDKDAKAGQVAGVFHSVAARYDLMNDLMSGGIHRLWKRFTIELSGVRKHHAVLHIAGGTGDLAARFAELVGPEGRVVLAVANMEALGLRIARLANRRTRAQQGPFVRRHYDAPPDHLTRYDPGLLRAQVERHVEIEAWVGVSLFWGNFFWGRLLRRCPERISLLLLRAADAVARLVPSWADLIIVAGRPKRVA